MNARLLASVGLLAVLSTCSNAGGCGQVRLSPLPGGRLQAPKTDDAVSMRLTATGLQAISAPGGALANQLAGLHYLPLSIPCSVKNFPTVGDLVFADQGSAHCSSASCGLMDGVCDARDLPAWVVMEIESVALTALAPDRLEAKLELRSLGGSVAIDSVTRSHPDCNFQHAAQCSLGHNFGLNAPATLPVKMGLTLSLDPRWDQLVSVQLTSVDGFELCGSPGASPPPACIEDPELTLTPNANCSGSCQAPAWDAVRAHGAALMRDALKDSLAQVISLLFCQSCVPFSNDCPQLAGAKSVCESRADFPDQGLCRDTTTGACVPYFTGIEGRLPVSQAFPALGLLDDAMLDLSLAVGGKATTDTGLNLGMRGAAVRASQSDWVPARPPLVTTPVPAPDFDAEATQPYDLALSVSRAILDQTLFEAQQSGALTVSVDSHSVPLLDSGLLRPLLPSLGLLAAQEGGTAAMKVVLRPVQPPRVQLGKGTYDPQTHKPIDPLLTLELPELAIDFYIQLDDRFVRAFTLSADLALPLSITSDGCSRVLFTVGDLSRAVRSVHAAPSELLVEDLGTLEGLVPLFISLAEPQLASLLPTLTVPPLMGSQLKLLETRGLGSQGPSGRPEHLGVYARLLAPGASCAVAAPTLNARWRGQQLRPGQGQKPPTPQALIDIGSSEITGGLEVTTRVDGGFWSEFERVGVDGLLTVTNPAFLLQGVHTVEVRGRSPERPDALSLPATLTFVSDWEGPRVKLKPDRGADRLRVWATDAVSPPSTLKFAYRWGEGNWSAPGPKRDIALAAVEAAGLFEVQVIDEAGHVTVARYRSAR